MACREVTPTEEEAIQRAVRFLGAQEVGSEWTATVRLLLNRHAILTAYRSGIFPPPTRTLIAGPQDDDVQVVTPGSLSAVATHLFETEADMALVAANSGLIVKALQTLLPGGRVLYSADDITPRAAKAAAYDALRRTIGAPDFFADRFQRSLRLWFLNGTNLEEWRVGERGGKATVDRTVRLPDVVSFDE